MIVQGQGRGGGGGGGGGGGATGEWGCLDIVDLKNLFYDAF